MHGLRFLLDHRFTRRRLSAYVDAELEPVERARVERHVGECLECAGMSESLERLVAGLALLGRSSPSSFAARVCRALRIRRLPAGEAGKR